MQINNRPWIAFFSCTGQEIYNVMSFFDRKPDAIITNRQDDEGLFAPLKAEKDTGNLNWITLPVKPELKHYKNALKKFKKPVITLHGYLRILPKDICKKYNIFNLHPGLITEYPELKGKDPQKRAIEAGYKRVGCVIHRVIPEVDEGEILIANELNAVTLTDERIYENLKSLGTVMWYEFFNNFEQYEHRRNSKNNRDTIPGDLY
jgi:folate-dependent phosphoribosylglycinamide formyltransferase PurN